MTAQQIELRRKRAALVAGMRKENNKIEKEERAYTTEETEQFDERKADIAGYDVRIERQVKIDELDLVQGAIVAAETVDERTGMTSAEVGAEAVQGWMRSRSSEGLELTARQKHAMTMMKWQPGARYIDIPRMKTEQVLAMARGRLDMFGREQRMTTVDNVGGELIPQGFVPSIEMALLATSRLREWATILQTATGNPLPWPIIDDTSNTAETPAEGASITPTDVVTDEVVFGAQGYKDIVKVSMELMQDTPFNMTSVIGEILGKRIGRSQNTDFTTGSGSGKVPKGIITAATSAFTSTSKTALVNDEIRKMPYQVDPEYQQGSKVAWMMHNFFVQEVRLIKEATTNRYMWDDGHITAGQPPTLMGYPVLVNQGMASAHASGAKIIAFGDLSKYLIRDAGPIRIIHLVERYADEANEAFLALMRSDGDLLDAGTKPVKFITQLA